AADRHRGLGAEHGEGIKAGAAPAAEDQAQNIALHDGSLYKSIWLPTGTSYQGGGRGEKKIGRNFPPIRRLRLRVRKAPCEREAASGARRSLLTCPSNSLWSRRSFDQT